VFSWGKSVVYKTSYTTEHMVPIVSTFQTCKLCGQCKEITDSS